MKKLVLICILSSTVFYSCNKNNSSNELKVEESNTYDGYVVVNEGVQVLVIDSCEYVWCKNGYGAGIAHKGNCRFCRERNINGKTLK